MEHFTIPSLGDVRAEAEGFAVSLCADDAQPQTLTLRLHAPLPTVPRQVKLRFDLFLPDVYSSWSAYSDSAHFLRPDWGKARVQSRSASGVPIFCLLAQNGENRMTISLSDASEACCIAAGVCEETARFDFELTFFTALTTARTSYSVSIRLDSRRVPFTQAVQDARAEWDRLYPPCPVPEAAREPLYSCWYSLHQQVFVQDVLRQCTLASPYGMRTVIIDDGWQTEDNNRGYAYCGDWQLAQKKIPDMAALADAVHALGMRFMIWYSVPFIGKRSANYERFKGKYLSQNDDLECCTLDPRFPECRAFLCETYRTAVERWHLDGLKLDFIDSFHLTEDSAAPCEQMDYISIEQAVQALLREVTDTLRAADPDFMIEFRQSYVGPVMRQFGNMLRVGDCPGAAKLNRAGSITLRLLSGRTAVHSDMVMWNALESAATAADQLTAILYCVPQISVRLETLPEPHRRMLRFYLDFWRSKRDILLDGTLTAEDPDVSYSLVCAARDGEAVITTYLRESVSLRSYSRGTVVNASAFDALLLDAGAIRYRVFDCTGTLVSEGNGSGLFRVCVPHSGMLMFENE